MPRPVSVCDAYELLQARQEQRDPRPEYVLRNAELVPVEGGRTTRPGTVTEVPQARRELSLSDEHDLRDVYEVE